MTAVEQKRDIAARLCQFAQGRLSDNAFGLFGSLGYHSDARLNLESDAPHTFLEALDPDGKLDPERALVSEWRAAGFLFQLTQDDLITQISMFKLRQYDRMQYLSYVFLAIELQAERYARGKLAQITREVNKLFPMPAMVLFKHGGALTLAVINRRPNKLQQSKDVLEKVTLIKDIAFAHPHRAHIEILHDLSLEQLKAKHPLSSFNDLHDAWQKTLDSSELNKRFYQEVANWYFWAMQNVTFPQDIDPDPKVRNAISVIRLITRLIFVWFLREKGLVPDDLFEPRELKKLLKYDDPQDSTYYKAVLQNLFFATLNQEMNCPAHPDSRKFRARASKERGRERRN